MFPALVRYDECERGMVEHALRLVVAKTRREYIYPATHYASSISASVVDVPAMGQRLRLKASFTIPESWTTEEKSVLRALKKYGATWRITAASFPSPSTPMTASLRPQSAISPRSTSAISKCRRRPSRPAVRVHQARR